MEKERRKNVGNRQGKETKEERGQKRRREEEKEGNETGSVRRRCVNFVSVEAFDIFGQGGDLESCGGLSWRDLLEKPEALFDSEPATRVEVPVVLDVPVSPSSVVTEFCDVFSCCPNWEFVEPKSFSFSKKRAHSCTVTQEEMRSQGSQVKAPPVSRRIRPPTPLQNSNSSFGEEQGRFEVGEQKWSARERMIIARTKQYLEESRSLKVEVEELESMLGPDDSDVDFRCFCSIVDLF